MEKFSFLWSHLHNWYLTSSLQVKVICKVMRSESHSVFEIELKFQWSCTLFIDNKLENQIAAVCWWFAQSFSLLCTFHSSGSHWGEKLRHKGHPGPRTRDTQGCLGHKAYSGREGLRTETLFQWHRLRQCEAIICTMHMQHRHFGYTS